jgi:beta-lactamase superfamily II metal-dependent hydrolase
MHLPLAWDSLQYLTAPLLFDAMWLAAALLPFFTVTPAHAQTAELEVVFFDVGMGDATLIISPSGKTMLIDGGLNGHGDLTILPELLARDIQRLDYVSATHYHNDHVGGLDEIAKSHVSVGEVLDRGDIDLPNSQPFLDYQSAFQGKRRQILPGELIDLGDGVTMRCLAVNGVLAGGAAIDLSGTAQQENSASVSWLLSYGDFQLFVGGDLTGGSSTSVNVEKPVAMVSGDVDVYKANMHGSAISSTGAFLRLLRPEFVVLSVGTPNSSNFPRADTLARLNPPGSAIPVWSTSPGNGGYGFVDAGGHIYLSSDGTTYTARNTGELEFTAWCDEVPTVPYPAATLAITEFHRDSASVKDFNGEWFEVTGTIPVAPAGMLGTRVIVGAGEEFTLGINLRLDAGKSIVFGSNGLPVLNGGYTPTIAWPEGAIALNDGNAPIILADLHGNEIERVNYSAGWPGGNGVSAERINALLPPTIDNFMPASAPYGNGDLGTPGKRNSHEVTDWFPGGPSWIGYKTAPKIGMNLEMVAEMPGEAGSRYRAALSFGTEPGINYRGTNIPINSDTMFVASSGTKGWFGYVPANEVVTMAIKLPHQTSLLGQRIYALVATLGPGGVLNTWSSPIPMVIGQD